MAYHKSYAGVGGRAYIIPSGANPDVMQFAVIKNWSLELSQEEIELRGSDLDVLDRVASKRDLKGKIAISEISTALLNAVTAGGAITTGSMLPAVHSAAVPTTPYQITVTNSATFDKDLGVIDKTSAKELACVASAPATGEYSYAAGVYTFAAADTAHNVAIHYRYTSTAGKTITVSGASAGSASTTYGLFLLGTAGGKSYSIEVPAVTIPNLSLSMSPDAWADVSLDFAAKLDANSVLYKAHLVE
jgi:hypothetical protein